jgi:hypothetical protein
MIKLVLCLAIASASNIQRSILNGLNLYTTLTHLSACDNNTAVLVQDG